jgi:molybdopterin-guanine dinucleotide biosynthesis protein B
MVSIVGASGSGKTTFLTRLIPELRARGYCVAVIKHHPHAGLETDTPGKDTWRLMQAGAVQVTLAAPDQLVHRRKLAHERSPEEIAAEIRGVDLILTEGYKGERLLKVEINRRAHHPTLISPRAELLAIVSDQHFNVSAPQFDLEDISGVADLIEAHVLRHVERGLSKDDPGGSEARDHPATGSG